MSVTIMPNTGILMDDNLDKLRRDALVEAQSGLPEAVVCYLRALESAYLGMKMEQKKSALRDIGWKFVKTGAT